jgi:hypothetical protein
MVLQSPKAIAHDERKNQSEENKRCASPEYTDSPLFRGPFRREPPCPGTVHPK